MNSCLNETESKWTCEYCTYENWPSSLKCTMCRGAKPLLGEDIYRLRDPSPQRSGSNVAAGPVNPFVQGNESRNLDSQNISQNVPSGGKWYCEMCTYLNYQNASRCVQCGNRNPVKSNQLIHNLASNLHEHLAPLILGDPPPSPPPPPPPPCNTTITNITGSNSQLNNPTANLPLPPDKCYDPQSKKWSCLTCTYENWPKAVKCIMCGQQKEREKKDRILPSPERDARPQRGLPSPLHLHHNQRDENLATARR